MNDYEIKKLYEEMELHLIQSMKRNFGRHLTEENEVGFKFTQWQAEKLKELKRYQRENKKIIGRYTLGLDEEVSEHLQNELKQGSIEAIKQYNKALGKDLKPSKVMNKSFFQTNDKKVKALIEVVNNDLKTANTSALRMLNDQYRQIIHKSAFFVGNGAFTEKQAAAQAVEEISQKKLTTLAVDEASKNFLAGGLNCIEYSDGRRVNIASYAQMAVRTASLRTHLMGEGNFRASIGRTLVKVTTHGGACKLCTKWQGKVLVDDVYSGGKPDGKHTLLSEAMAQGFLHPNCRHGITTYYPELEEDDEEEPTTPIDEKLQQEYNYYNRLGKSWKRREKGFLDPTNKRKAKENYLLCERKKEDLIVIKNDTPVQKVLNYTYENTDKIEEYIRNYDSKDSYANKKAALEYVVKDLKLDNKPNVLTEVEFDELLENEDSKLLWRGFYDDNDIQKNVDKHIDGFYNGEFKLGNGDIRSGAGYNFTANYGVAQSFARGIKHPHEENIVETILNPNADLIEFKEVEKIIGKITERNQDLDWLTDNYSYVASLLGYDGIIDSEKEVYVIINRGILNVRK